MNVSIFPVNRAPVTLLLCNLVLVLFAAIGSQAHANQVFSSDCFFGLKEFFGSNETVCASGDVDTGGFIFPEGHICVTSNQIWSSGNGISDVTAGGCNFVVGTGIGGSFIDEPVWQPPLTEGRYDMLVDENMNGVFDAGLDFSCGSGTDWCFQVGAPVANPIDLSDLKDRAADQFEHWDSLAKNWHWVSDGATAISLGWSLASGDWVSVGVSIGSVITGVPSDYNSAVLNEGGKIIVGLAKPQAERWRTLRDDPPDPDFMTFAELNLAAVNAELDAVPGFPGLIPGPGYPFAASSTNAFEITIIELLNQMAVQAGLVTALTSSLEKFQGASDAANDTFIFIQARASKQYADLLVDNLSNTRSALLDYDAMLANDGLDTIVYSAAEIQSVLDRLNNTGLTAAEEQSLRDSGFGNDDIAALLLRVATVPGPVGDFTRGATTDALVSAMNASITDVQALSAQAQTTMDGLGPFLLIGHPTADAGGPYTGDEGAPIALDGSGSSDPEGAALNFLWDFDLDGQFDDATGVAPSLSINDAGIHIIGLRVTDPGGLTAVNYSNVTIADVNGPPVITAFEPVDVAPTASSSAPLVFSVTATDPDLDALTYQWTLDGAVMSTATTWSYTAGIGETGTRVVRITVSDGSPLSIDTHEQRVVRIVGGITDQDQDGIADNVDNCTSIANADQRDTNGDDIGNACDADIDNNCTVNFLDSFAYRDNFFQPGDFDTDNDGDGFTNFIDLMILSDQFFGPPGPSATPCTPL